jgi:hypothetical protein
MAAAFDVGKDVAEWGDSRWLYHLTNGDPQAAVQFTRLLGAFSPGQKTHVNVLNAIEAFVRSSQGESSKEIMGSLMHGHPRPSTVRDNFERAIQGGRIFQNKVEALAGSQLGAHDAVPIDMWLLRALGVESDKTPSKGTYKLVSEAIAREAEEAGEPSPFLYMAKVWAGMQRIAGKPTPSFSEATASLGLEGPITHAGTQQQVLSQSDDLAKAAFAREPKVSPIAQNPSRSYDQWFEEAQAMYRSGLKAGDVLGKQKVVKFDRPTTLKQLKDRETKRAKPYPKPQQAAAQ